MEAGPSHLLLITNKIVSSHIILDVEPKENAISFLDNIVLALTAEKALGLGLLLASRTDKVIISNCFGADEAPLEIVVDNAGGLRCLPSPLDSPRPSLSRSRREVGLKLKKVVLPSSPLPRM